METRSIKDLLIILLKLGKKKFISADCTGLCGLASYAYQNDHIGEQEKWKLVAYINKKCNGQKEYYYYSNQSSPFYFPRTKWAPRERWLKEQIEKL